MKKMIIAATAAVAMMAGTAAMAAPSVDDLQMQIEMMKAEHDKKINELNKANGELNKTIDGLEAAAKDVAKIDAQQEHDIAHVRKVLAKYRKDLKNMTGDRNLWKAEAKAKDVDFKDDMKTVDLEEADVSYSTFNTGKDADQFSFALAVTLNGDRIKSDDDDHSGNNITFFGDDYRDFHRNVAKAAGLVAEEAYAKGVANGVEHGYAEGWNDRAK